MGAFVGEIILMLSKCTVQQ